MIRSFTDAVTSNHTIKQVVKEVALENIETEDFKDTVVDRVKKDVIKRASPMIKQTYDRQRSVIVSGLKESGKDTWYDRHRDDMDKVVTVLSWLHIRNIGSEIASVTRLGKYSESKSRLIKVTFVREEVQREVMSLARNLKNSEAYKDVFIRSDRTKDELEKIKAHVQEAKARNDRRNEVEKSVFYWRAEGLKGVKKIYM